MSESAGYNTAVLDNVRDAQNGNGLRSAIAPTFQPSTGRFEMTSPRIGYSINNGIDRAVYHGDRHATFPTPYVDGTLEPCAKALYGKKAVVVGLGSFGGRIVLELAAAGVSEFEVWDADIIEKQNLSRHVAGISDVGKLKVDAIRRLALEKNPAIKYIAHATEVQADAEAFKHAVENCDVVIAATDNNPSRYFMDDISRAAGKTIVFSRAFVRAEGGDAFLGRPDGPSYCDCLNQISNKREEVTSEKQGRRRGDIPAYASANDVGYIVQPGLGVDIMPILHFHLKLALMVLAHGTPCELKSFESEIDDTNYFIWASVRREGNPFGEIFRPFANSENMPTCFKWYPMRVNPSSSKNQPNAL